MKTWPFLAFALLAACVDPGAGQSGAGNGKADGTGSAYTDVATQWELTVGYAGDAVVAHVTPTEGGRLLVTSQFPRWLRGVTPAGALDNTFGTPYGESTERSGVMSVTAHEVWPVSSGIVASVGDGGLFELDRYGADGTADPDFGNAGKVSLPDGFTGLDGQETALVVRDPAAHRFVAAVVREWQLVNFGTQPQPVGPKKIELLAFDETTGAMTSAGVFEMPDWGSMSTNPAAVRELVPEPDGSFLLLTTQVVYTDNPVRASVATQWSMFHLQANQAPVATTLAVTEYDAPVAGFVQLGDGHFDLYLDGLVDGISTTSSDRKLVRIGVDDVLTPQLDVVGPAVDLSHGCTAAVATPTGLIYGESTNNFTSPIQFTAFDKGAAPASFASDKIKRCLVSLSVAPNGHIYAGTWDTTNEGWTALLTSFVPR